MNNNGLKDYYGILEISRYATKEEIKTAYRKLVKTMHPDVNKEVDAKEKFQEISEAYEILYNDFSRKEYDKLLNESAKGTSDWIKKSQEFRNTEQKKAQEKAESYTNMSLSELLSIITDTLLYGEKIGREKYTLRNYTVLGIKSWICVFLVISCFSIVLTIPAIHFIILLVKSCFIRNGRFIGFVPIINALVIVYLELGIISLIIFIVVKILSFFVVIPLLY